MWVDPKHFDSDPNPTFHIPYRPVPGTVNPDLKKKKLWQFWITLKIQIFLLYCVHTGTGTISCFCSFTSSPFPSSFCSFFLFLLFILFSYAPLHLLFLISFSSLCTSFADLHLLPYYVDPDPGSQKMSIWIRIQGLPVNTEEEKLHKKFV